MVVLLFCFLWIILDVGYLCREKYIRYKFDRDGIEKYIDTDSKNKRVISIDTSDLSLTEVRVLVELQMEKYLHDD